MNARARATSTETESEGRLLASAAFHGDARAMSLARRLARVFGEGGVLVSSSKSLIAHTMAAAGSAEAYAY